jgi:hypothetical protein
MLITQNQLRVARHSAGLLQNALAEISGVSRNQSIKSRRAPVSFGANGEVMVKMRWLMERDQRPLKMREKVLFVLNAGRKAKSKATREARPRTTQ